MINAVNVGGLVMDISGAWLLARALVIRDVERYTEETVRPAGTVPFVASISPVADLDHARDYAECRLGLGLLVGGFTGQLIATVAPSGPTWLEIAFAIVAVAAVAAALIVRPRYVRVTQQAIFRARVRQIERAPDSVVNIDTWTCCWSPIARRPT